MLTVRSSIKVTRETLVYDRLLIRTETLNARAAAERLRTGTTGPGGSDRPGCHPRRKSGAGGQGGRSRYQHGAEAVLSGKAPRRKIGSNR